MAIWSRSPSGPRRAAGRPACPASVPSRPSSSAAPPWAWLTAGRARLGSERWRACSWRSWARRRTTPRGGARICCQKSRQSCCDERSAPSQTPQYTIFGSKGGRSATTRSPRRTRRRQRGQRCGANGTRWATRRGMWVLAPRPAPPTRMRARAARIARRDQRGIWRRRVPPTTRGQPWDAFVRRCRRTRRRNQCRRRRGARRGRGEWSFRARRRLSRCRRPSRRSAGRRSIRRRTCPLGSSSCTWCGCGWASTWRRDRRPCSKRARCSRPRRARHGRGAWPVARAWQPWMRVAWLTRRSARLRERARRATCGARGARGRTGRGSLPCAGRLSRS